MTEPNQSGDNQSPNNEPNSGNQTDADTKEELESTNNHNRHTNTSNRHPIWFKGFRNWINKENEGTGGIANIIAFLALIIGGFLAVYTYRVFNQTTFQTIASLKADSIAQASLDESKRVNGIAIKHQKTADSISHISDSVKAIKENSVFKLQKAALDTQISAIKQTQKQFEVSHSPYITVIGFGRTPADSLEIDIQNQGTQVAYLVELEYAVKAENSDGIHKKYKTTDDWNKWLTVPKNPSNTQSIMGPGNGGLQVFKTLKSVSDTDMNFVMQRRKTLFIRVVIYYFNTTTNKYMRYDYIAGWNPVDNLLGIVHFGYTVIKKYPE